MQGKKRSVVGVRDWPLDTWADEMWSLYGHHDVKRPVILMWLSVVEYGSKIAEDVRRDAFSDLLEHLTHVFTWIASFVAKCNHDSGVDPIFKFTDTFADIVAFKFPGRCGICKQATCTCGLVAEAIESVSDKKASYKTLHSKRKEFSTDNSGYRAKKVDDWARMFETIYGGRVKGLPLEHIAFHFMEEVGEVANAIRRIYEEKANFPAKIDKIDSIDKAVEYYERASLPAKQRRAVDLKLSLAIEIADSFSWWNSLYLKIAQIFKEAQSPLIQGTKPSFILQKRYKVRSGKLMCPDCGKAPCKCAIFISE